MPIYAVYKMKEWKPREKTFCRFMNRRYCFYHFCVDIFPLWTQGLTEKGLNLTSTPHHPNTSEGSRGKNYVV